MDESLQRESESLTRSWMQHEQDFLGEYLVSEVEDPRLNVQSVLTRHFLIAALFGRQFDPLLESELRFACILNWFCARKNRITCVEDVQALRHALLTKADNAEGLPIPGYVTAAFHTLPLKANGTLVPHYIGQILDEMESSNDSLLVSEKVLSIFEEIWRGLLAGQAPRGVAVCEPASGSANDYRFLQRFGLARLTEYTGFDLCEKNVRNALQMFPEARFSLGNVFEISAGNLSFDYTFVHDLFEHLSVAGLETALDDVCRITRKGLCLGFFNLHEGAEHVIRPVDEYHWNALSLPRLRNGIDHRGFDVEVVHIDTLLRWRFGCADTHNKNAYTLFGTRRLVES
jgi:hypothetical protein